MNASRIVTSNTDYQVSSAPRSEPPAEISDLETELSRHLPDLGRMSEQLKQTTAQIEDAVVDVCTSFQGIAQRARETVDRAAELLSEETSRRDGRSFEALIESCSGTLVKVLGATEEVNEISRRAIERIREIDQVSEQVSSALTQLGTIAKGNKMLAMNARIEAAHAGALGVGFAVVAKEVVSQTDKSEKVTAKVSDLISALRTLAGSTLSDLRRMHEQDHLRVVQCRKEVDSSLHDLHDAHSRMAETLSAMTRQGEMVAADIGEAVRGLQFQDRTNQRIAHVVDELDALHEKLIDRFGADAIERATGGKFDHYTMQEEREVAGISGEESGQGDIELF